MGRDRRARSLRERAREASLGTTEMTPWQVSLGATRGSPEAKLGGKVDDITVLAVQLPARKGLAPEDMVGRVVPNVPAPRFAYRGSSR